jgi:hypothetical protein
MAIRVLTRMPQTEKVALDDKAAVETQDAGDWPTSRIHIQNSDLFHS